MCICVVFSLLCHHIIHESDNKRDGHLVFSWAKAVHPFPFLVLSTSVIAVFKKSAQSESNSGFTLCAHVIVIISSAHQHGPAKISLLTSHHIISPPPCESTASVSEGWNDQSEIIPVWVSTFKTTACVNFTLIILCWRMSFTPSQSKDCEEKESHFIFFWLDLFFIGLQCLISLLLLLWVCDQKHDVNASCPHVACITITVAPASLNYVCK